MSILLGRQKTCDICGKTVFKRYTGETSFYDLDGVTYDDNYDNKIDTDWKYFEDIGDLCPDCVKKLRDYISTISERKEENGE